MAEYKIRVSKIEKSFPGVKALDKIDFAVRKGTVHAICGENGAGKSTLMKIINGVYKPDGGEIFIDEQSVKIKNPIEARKYKIAMIAQELNYVPEMSVEENLFLGRLPLTKFNAVDWRKVRKETIELIQNENLDFTPTDKLKDLTISDIQMLEILKAISKRAEIIVMDEPTSSITNKEVEKLFEKIEILKKNGVSIIYISHKMNEIFKIADDITIFRDGKSIETRKAENFSINEIIALMVGRKIENIYPKEKINIGNVVLEIENLKKDFIFEDISFNVKKGEIIGFAGLVGAGRTEVMQTIFGMDSYDAGNIKIHGKKIEIKNVRDSIKNKIVMLSEDRKRYGIIPIRSVKENATISTLNKFIYGGKLHSVEEKETVRELFERLSVKTPGLDTSIQSLSGGNQQKVLLSRWVLTKPEILILDEPTRGIDVGAKFEIYNLITEMASSGKGIVIVSSELPELIGMCDRIYVMNQGRITKELVRDEFSQEIIMKYATN